MSRKVVTGIVFYQPKDTPAIEVNVSGESKPVVLPWPKDWPSPMAMAGRIRDMLKSLPEDFDLDLIEGSTEISFVYSGKPPRIN